MPVEMVISQRGIRIGIVVIEVKSSKVFDEVIIGDGNCNCLYKNIYSLFDAPYEQMIHSIKDIEKSCHELIKKEIEKIYIIVTFSNMPLMLIENNDTNKQYISNEKNSFSVMAFEMLLAASEVSGSTPGSRQTHPCKISGSM